MPVADDAKRLEHLESQLKNLEAELAAVRSHLSALLAALVSFGIVNPDQVDEITARATALAQKTSQDAQAVTEQIVNEAAHISYE